MILNGLPSTITKKLFILKELGRFLGFFWVFFGWNALGAASGNRVELCVLTLVIVS